MLLIIPNVHYSIYSIVHNKWTLIHMLYVDGTRTVWTFCSTELTLGWGTYTPHIPNTHAL